MVKQIEMTEQQKFRASFTPSRIKAASEWILENDVGVIHSINQYSTVSEQTVNEWINQVSYNPNNKKINTNKKGGMTLVYKVHNSVSKNTYIEVANAICTSKEQYNKAIGRTIAVERLKEGKYISLPYDKKMEITPQKIVYNLSNLLGYDVYLW